jgi:threonine dehydrogenase-like Zn-dependent dehydrogenase
MESSFPPEHGARPREAQALRDRHLRNLIHAGKAEPSFIVSHRVGLGEAPDAYQHFDSRDEGWTKVVLKPSQNGAAARA